MAITSKKVAAIKLKVKKVLKKKKTKKKGRKTRYITGIHISPKCEKPIHYRSGWELTVCQTILDQDPEVLCYSYESVGIPYRSPNLKSTKMRRYFPDFLVSYKNGTRLIVEVKRNDKIKNILTQTKAEACIKWAEKQGIKYQIWGSVEIKAEQVRLTKQSLTTKVTPGK